MATFLKPLNLVLLIILVACSAQNLKPCESYLKLIDNFADGYRGLLTLPVLDDVQKWEMKIEFSHKTFTLDVPQGDVTRNPDMKSFSVVNRPYNGRLKKGTTFRLEYTIHFPRWAKKLFRIKSIEFGRFRCPGKTDGEKPDIPKCDEFVQIGQKRDDGFLFSLNLPVMENTNGWWLFLSWTKTVKCLFYKGPVHVKSNDMKTFHYTSPTSRLLSKHSQFRREFNVSFLNEINSIMEEIKFGKFHCAGFLENHSIYKEKEPCDNVFHITNEGADGFTGNLTLPVPYDMTGFEFHIDLSKKVSSLQLRNAGVAVLWPTTMTSFIIKESPARFYKKSSILNIPVVVKYDNQVKSHFTRVEFAGYKCSGFMESTETSAINPCKGMFTMLSQGSFGYTGKLVLPILNEEKEFNLHLGFNKALKQLKTHLFGATYTSSPNITSIQYNGMYNIDNLKPGAILEVPLTVYSDNALKPYLTSVKFNGYECNSFPLPQVEKCGSNVVKVLHEDSTKFTAEIEVPVLHDSKGWSLQLVFDKKMEKFVSYMTGNVIITSPRVMRVMNYEETGTVQLKKGSKFTIKFTAIYDNGIKTNLIGIKFGSYQCGQQN